MKFASLLFLFISVNLCAQDTIPPIFPSFWPTDTVVLDVFNPLSSLNQKIEATDNVDGNLTANIKVTGSYPNRFGTGAAAAIGIYECIYTVSDKAGNSTSRSVYVDVQDRVAPLIFLTDSADTLLLLKVGEKFTKGYLDIADNYYSAADITIKILEKVNSSVQARYGVCYYGIDPSGNHADTIYQTVCVGLDKATCLALPKPACADVTVNVGKPATKEMVMIYPNPSSGTFQIKTTSTIHQIEISDAAGHHWIVPSNSTRLDIEEAGMYLVRISTSKGIQNHKLIVE